MSKYSVDINVKSRVGRAGTEGAGTRENIRMSSERAKEIRKAAKEKKAKGDPRLGGSIKELNKQIDSLGRRISDLASAVNRLSSGAGPAAGGPGTGGIPGRRAGFRGAGVGVGAGAGLGRIGAAAPIAGVFIGALGFAISKIVQVGRANIQKTLEQAATAGVGGFQASGRFLGVFSAAEYGAYEKRKKMAAGRMFLPPEDYPGIAEREPLGVTAKAMFPEAPVARVAGLAYAMDPAMKSGEGFTEKVIQQIVQGQRGLTTELPFILNEVTGRMEEAVREGVNNAELGPELAKRLAVMGQGTLTGQARSALRTEQNLRQMRQQVSRGQISGIGGWQYALAARDVIQEDSERGKRTREYLKKSGLFAPGTQFEGGLGPEQMRMAVQFLNQSDYQGVIERWSERTVPTLMGKGDVYQRFARFNKLAIANQVSTDTMMSLNMFKDYERREAPEKLQRLVDRRTLLEKEKRAAKAREDTEKDQGFFEDIWTGVKAPFVKSSDDVNKEITAIERQIQDPGKLGLRTLATEELARRGKLGTEAKTEFEEAEQATGYGRVRAAKAGEGVKEQMVLNATRAASATRKIEGAFIRLAGTLANPETGLPIDQSINALTTSINILSKGAASAIKIIVEAAGTVETAAQKIKGFGDFIDRSGKRKAFQKPTSFVKTAP